MKRISFAFLFAIGFLLIVSPLLTHGAPPKARVAAKTVIAKEPEAAVVFNDQTMFYVQARVLSFSPEERARLIEARLRKLAKDPTVTTDSIAVTDAESTTEIAAGDLVLVTLTNEDAKAAGKKRSDLAREYAGIIKKAMDEQRQAYSVKAIAIGLLLALGLTGLFVLFNVLLKRMFLEIYTKLESWRGVRIPAIKLQSIELLSSDRVTSLLISMTGWIRLFIVLIALYLYVVLLLTFFPWTKNLSSRILSYIITPVSVIWNSFVSYLPDLFFLSIVILVTYYGLKIAKFLLTAAEKGIITLPGFYPEWGQPTYGIVRLLILAFATVVAFPYLPGSDSPAFKGISIFIGVLLSLGSTSAVASVVAGAILTYMRAFRVGERVKISDTVGDVIERTLLITRVRTIKNEDITIPNALILGSHIVNYSSLASESGLILHTSVTIGYDVPWKTVHELLLHAARNTAHILEEPAPFVLQKSLDDFYVRYEINAYTNQPSKMASIYSDLHQNIQDSFSQGGVEIMSPHYAALREGNLSTIPEENRPKAHVAQARGVGPAGDPADEKV